MTERPIIFSAPMVRAILEGRKTQTRRVLKPIPKYKDGSWSHSGGERWHLEKRVPQDHGRVFIADRGDWWCPFGSIGDRLWVRETFTTNGPAKIDYRADGDPACAYRIRWMPSIHMPRWICRITLDVVAVRVERLQEISEDDMQAEGVDWLRVLVNGAVEYRNVGPAAAYATRPILWRALWDNLNAKRGHSWNANPWVWVIEFKRAA